MSGNDADIPWHVRVDRDAAQRLARELAKPTPSDEWEIGQEEFFDPWPMFGLYGSYSSDFDKCALDVLRELASGEKKRDDLGAEMFREMLCNLHLCDYGSSPRVCFPTSEMKPLLQTWVDKWQAFTNLQWREP